MSQAITKRKSQQGRNHTYKFVKWAYGSDYAIIDEFNESGTPVRRFIDKAVFYKNKITVWTGQEACQSLKSK